ncbi:hypothetical protein [Variovorax sp. UC122_21]|uniref:hypothetical protein n=1 Tax=Variovorax sp. UC122_21 TaxID=3374554 RepID=UPI0037572E47
MPARAATSLDLQCVAAAVLDQRRGAFEDQLDARLAALLRGVLAGARGGGGDLVHGGDDSKKRLTLEM